MRGLKTQERAAFERYFAVVQENAKQESAVFFLFAGEGHEAEEAGMELMDLSGWKIPQSEADRFETVWKTHAGELEEWEDFFTFAIWSGDAATPRIIFKRF